jgi:TRAP-type C4-dicarboxylate transport system permease small subunit
MASSTDEKDYKSPLNPLLRGIDFIDFLLSKFESFMLAFGVIAIALTTIAAVVTRFVFNDALTVTDELNMIFIVIVTFAGLSYAARNARHIRMSAIYDAFSAKYRKVLMIFIGFVTAVFMFILSYYSGVYIIEVYQSGRILPALKIPVYLVYLWVPIGFFVTGLQYFFTVIQNLRQKDVYISTKVRDGYCENEIEV